MVKKAALAAIRAVDEDANGKVSFEELERVINPGGSQLVKNRITTKMFGIS